MYASKINSYLETLFCVSTANLEIHFMDQDPTLRTHCLYQNELRDLVIHKNMIRRLSVAKLETLFYTDFVVTSSCGRCCCCCICRCLCCCCCCMSSRCCCWMCCCWFIIPTRQFLCNYWRTLYSRQRSVSDIWVDVIASTALGCVVQPQVFISNSTKLKLLTIYKYSLNFLISLISLIVVFKKIF